MKGMLADIADSMQDSLKSPPLELLRMQKPSRIAKTTLSKALLYSFVSEEYACLDIPWEYGTSSGMLRRLWAG